MFVLHYHTLPSIYTMLYRFYKFLRLFILLLDCFPINVYEFNIWYLHVTCFEGSITIYINPILIIYLKKYWFTYKI